MNEKLILFFSAMLLQRTATFIQIHVVVVQAEFVKMLKFRLLYSHRHSTKNIKFYFSYDNWENKTYFLWVSLSLNSGQLEGLEFLMKCVHNFLSEGTFRAVNTVRTWIRNINQTRLKKDQPKKNMNIMWEAHFCSCRNEHFDKMSTL